MIPCTLGLQISEVQRKKVVIRGQKAGEWVQNFTGEDEKLLETESGDGQKSYVMCTLPPK